MISLQPSLIQAPKSFWTSSAVPAVNTATNIVLAASNTKGVILHYGSLVEGSILGGGSPMGVILCNAATPTTETDGDIYVSVDNIDYVNTSPLTWFTHGKNEVAILVPAGKGIWHFQGTGPATFARRKLAYTIL